MLNATSFHPDYFLLMGIPGLRGSHFLIAIPFCIMYLISLLGNGILLVVIAGNETLHQPMYMFLMMLAISDILLSSSAVPKTLEIFWFSAHAISFQACLIQVFFIHFYFGTDSAILLAMAYDRYCAICRPLTYFTDLDSSFIWKAAMFALLRSVFLVTPFVFLLNRLPFRQSNVIEHTYCEHMSVATLATEDITVNVVYGLVIAACATGIDITLIFVSYIMIISAVLRIPSSEARFKAFNTCVSHVCVIVLFYTPAFFSFIAHRVGHKYISLQVHILLANLYVLIPPMMNPIIYGMRTKEIRQRVLTLLCRFIAQHFHVGNGDTH